MPRKERNPYQPEFQVSQLQFVFSPPRESYLGRFVREVKEDITISSSATAGCYFLENVHYPIGAFPQEELWMMLLNTRNRITHQAFIYRGILDAAPIGVAEIYRLAIQFNSAAIMVAHNHPSGEPIPSPADISVTEQMVRCGALLSIACRYPIIVGGGRFMSLREAKLDF